MAGMLCHDLLFYIAEYVGALDIINFCTIDKETYAFSKKLWQNDELERNMDLIDKAIYSHWNGLLCIYQAFTGDECENIKQTIYNILMRDISVGRVYDHNFVLLKPCHTRFNFVNVLFNEDLALWSPPFPTWSFEKNKQHWIASIITGRINSREMNTYSETHWRLCKLIQNMTMQMRTVIDRCNSVRVVGAPYAQWDDTPPTPMRALHNIKVYCKWCDQVPIKYGPKRRAAQGLKHIPTTYINRYTNEVRKSFHPRQCMDLHQGSQCQVRLRFSAYQCNRQPWVWYLRIMFDKIKIYKTC